MVQHCKTGVHKTKKKETAKESTIQKELQLAIENFKEEVAEANDGAEVTGLVCVAQAVQTFRDECLEEWPKAGIALNKLNKMRS